MSKKSVLKDSFLKSSHNRNAFPIGHTEAFQAPLGALLPVAYYDVPADSFFEMNMENQTVMSPVVRPAFCILKEHFDVFAVPKVQLLQRYDNFITSQAVYDNAAVQQASQVGTSLPSVPNSVPMFDGTALAQALYYLYNTSDDFGCNMGFNACRLLDLLGYGNFYTDVPNLTGSFPDSGSNLDGYIRDTYLPTNFFNLLAYQKIYYSAFCNRKYEMVDARAFNIDDLNDIVYQWTGTSSERLQMMLTMHYVQSKKDYFNSQEPYVMPTGNNISVNYRSISTTPVVGNLFQVFGIPGTTWNTQNQEPAVTKYATTGNIQSNGEAVRVSDGNPSYGTISATSIRFAFAFDKLLRRMRSAGPNFNAQMLAQFGVKPVDERHGDAKKLGGWTNQLRISEVTSMADIGTADLGSLGGKMTSYSNNSKKIKYHAKEDCIIMVVYHTSLDPMYSSYNVDRCNLKRYRFDWFNPVFENMGLQPVFFGEYSSIKDDNSAFASAVTVQERATLDDQRSIIGYNKRYMEYKSKLNKVHGLFQWQYKNADQNAWVPTRKDIIYDESNHRFNYYNPIPFARENFMQSPFSLNDVLQTSYDGTWETDPFYVFAYFDTKLIANMSVDGETF